MGACLTCCAIDAGCGAVRATASLLRLPFKWGQARGARFMNALIFFSWTLLVAALNKYGVGYLSKIGPAPTFACDATCKSYFVTYKLGLGMALYHIIQAMPLDKICVSGRCRAGLREGFWLVKFLLLLSCSVGALFLPYPFASNFFYPAIAISGLFLLLQAALLVDLAYSTVEGLIDAAEEKAAECYKAILVGTTILCNLASVVGIIGFFTYFKGELEKTLLIASAFFLVVSTICSILPRVQEANPHAGIFQSSVLGFYSIFVLVSALISKPSDTTAAAITTTGTTAAAVVALSPKMHPWLQVAIRAMAFICQYLALARAALANGASAHRLFPESEGLELGDEDAGGDGDDECSYSLLHINFAMASLYTVLIVTNWQQMGFTGGTSHLQDTNVGFWVKVANSWTSTMIYLWSLAAPLVFEDRQFY